MSNDEEEYSLEMSFYIDTPGYTDRDREMFICGYEFCSIYQHVKTGNSWEGNIHTENESRIRLMCGKLNRAYRIDEIPDYPGWRYLQIGPVL